MFFGKRLLYVVVFALVGIGLASCGPNTLRRFNSISEERVRDRGDVAGGTLGHEAEDPETLTGAVSSTGAPYTQFVDAQTLATVQGQLKADQANKDFAAKIEWVQALVNQVQLTMTLTLKWTGVQEPLIFEGSLKPKPGAFSSELSSKQNQNNLKVFAHALNTGVTLIEALIEKPAEQAGQTPLQSKILIQVKQSRLIIQTAEDADLKKLPATTQSWVNSSKTDPAKQVVTSTSTTVMPQGRSFYRVDFPDGSHLDGPLVDAADQAAIANPSGPLAQHSSKAELTGNSRRGELLFKVTPKAASSNPAPRAQKPQSGSTAAPSGDGAPPPIYLFVVDPSKATGAPNPPPPPAQPKPAPPKSPQPGAQTAGKGTPPAPPTQGVHWMVKQIIEDKSQPVLVQQLYKNFSKPDSASGPWRAVESTHGRLIKDLLAVAEAEPGANPKKVEYAKKIMDTLRANEFPVVFAWQSYLESKFDPNAVSTKDARGFWQFMSNTKKMYFRAGDRVDDPVTSTEAATRLLTNLLKRWNSDLKMALASYNWGERGVISRCFGLQLNAAGESCDVSRNAKLNENFDISEMHVLYKGLGSFWRILELRPTNGFPLETREYVLNFMAGALVSFNPEAYGYVNKKPLPTY